MSAESELAGLITHATASAATLASKADSLINDAVAALESELKLGNVSSSYAEHGMDFPSNFFFSGSPDNSQPKSGFWDGWFFDNVWYAPNPTTPNQEHPTSFPAWPHVSLRTAPKTQELDTVTLDVDKFTFPTLSFPRFLYPTVVGAPQFTPSLPETDTITLPDAPKIESVYTPQFLDPGSVDSVTLTVEPPTLADLDMEIPSVDGVFNTALGDFSDSMEGESGPGRSIASLDTWSSELCRRLMPMVFDIIRDRLDNKESVVWPKNKQLRERLTDRLTEEQTRFNTAIEDRSGWNLPAAVLAAKAGTAKQLISAWQSAAEEQVDLGELTDATAFFELCANLVKTYSVHIQKLKGQEIQLIFEAHKTALAYAKQVVTALLAEYSAENYVKADIKLQQDEALLKQFEAELTIALLNYENAKARLQSEVALQERDAVSVQKLTAEMAEAEHTARRTAALVAARRTEVALRKLPIEQFELQVKAFNAKINAHEAQVDALVAEVEGDQNRVSGQLKKLAGYEASVQGFRQLIATKQLRGEAQSVRNESVLNEFQQRVKAALAPVDQATLKAAYDYKKYEVQISNLLADAQLALNTARMELNFKDKKKEGEQEVYQLNQERNFELMKSELARMQAIAEVNAQGSSILAEMARGAMSAANGVVSVVLKEDV